MAKKTFVLYPSLGVGHLIPMVELAKHLLRHGIGALIAVVDPPDTDAVSAAAVARLAAANPAITFRLLPAPASPDASAHPVKRSLDTLRLANPALRELLRSLPAVDALLLDMFCVDALDVAAELGVPAYFFFPSAAGDLAIFLNLPYLYPTLPSFRDMGKTLVRCPGMPPIRALDVVITMQDKESDPTKVRMYQFKRIPEGRGVLVNSFDWLEPRALKALEDGVCVPDRPTPRVYCIGPLVNDRNKGGERRDARVPRVAGHAAGAERRVPLLRQQGRLLCRAATGDRPRIGELRPPVLVGGEEPAGRARPVSRTGLGAAASGRVLGEDEGQRNGGEELGSAGGGGAARGGRRVRDALRVELRSRGHHVWAADDMLAAVRGAGDEQGVHGGGDEDSGGVARVRGACQGGGGGSEGEAGDGD